jgi:hypothetical protein
VLFTIVPSYRVAQARDRDRTGDLILTKDALYRLSYASDITPSVRSIRSVHRFGLPARPVFSLQAGDGTRTRDPQLGRLMLYQLSYTRDVPLLRCPAFMVGVGFEPT